MPSKSKAQHNFMAAIANSPSFAKKAGVPMSVGKDFVTADKGKKFKEGGTGWGCDIIERSEIIDKENNILLDGALIADAHLQFQPQPKSLTVTPRSHSKNMLQLLDDSESEDVKLKVKRTVITAHKLILKANAPILFDFCKGCKEGEMVKIDNISPAIFKIIIRYAYGAEIPGKETIMIGGYDNIGKDIIDAADRFGIVSLKLAVETILVENLVLCKENVAEWIVFAESKTCPLIKEAAIAFFIARSKDLLHSESTREVFKDSPELMAELMEEMSNRMDTDTRFDGREGSMSVIELRKKLGEEGLDLDGSKEILVTRLEESNKRQRTE